MGALVAGAKYRGEFEAAGKVILFIDEIHLVLGAGRMEGSVDAANLFKPVLVRSQLWCIGATMLEEYHKYVGKDASFVFVAEPSIADTISILSGLKEKYDGHHGVRIEDCTLVIAAQLSSRYIMGRHLPDKPIDLVDEAYTNVRVQPCSSTASQRRLITSMRSKKRRTRPAKPGWLRCVYHLNY